MKSTNLYKFFHRIYWMIIRKLKPISGKGNKISISKYSKAKINYNIIGDNNLIELDEKSSVTCNVYIRGNNHHIKIGKNVVISNADLWFEDHDGKIFIDDNTTIESAHLAVTEPQKSILIGKDCMLANNIEIRTGDSHSIFDTNSNQRINYAQDVIIKDHVWIGNNACILKGVQIQENSIIATQAVVTSNIGSNTLAAGIPAKVIKTNIRWTRERHYNY